MKKYFLLLALCCLSFGTFAQFTFGGQQPKGGSISVKATPSKTKVDKGEKIKVTLDVTIDAGWHLYSNDFQCDPIKFTAPVDPSDKYKATGALIGVGATTKMDEIFGCEVKYFENKATFTQEVIVNESGKISGEYDGQICEDNGVCLPVMGSWETVEIVVVESGKAIVPNNNDQSSKTDNSSQKTITAGNEEEVVVTKATGVDCCCGDLKGLRTKVDSLMLAAYPNVQRGDGIGECDIPRRAGWDDIFLYGKPPKEKGQKAEALVVNQKTDDDFGALMAFFWASFLFGFAALLTPCVFPLIPMTVTFFTKQSKSRAQGISKALIYGLSIVVIYTSIGLLFSKLGGVDTANDLATGLINLLFFAIFFVFALSFLGMFELTLPHRFVNKMDAKGDKGGLIGIFFMAFTLALVSFSCTGPIVGTVIIESFQGGWLKPIAGMLGFSIALALPFTLFAIFPQWMQSLPKSGGWLNTVKVVLGILELALGMKFLSNADLAYHWHILDRDVFITIWIVLFGTMGIYLLGKLRFPHDSPIEKLSVSRFIVALMPLILVVYMIPGLFGAPLKLLAGVVPPKTAASFELNDKKEEVASYKDGLCEEPKYGHELHIAHDLKGYFDFRQAICCAKRQKKPLFIDFTGHGCANCRRMEENVWSDPQVLKRLREKYVIASLYVDDRVIQLDSTEWYNRNSDGKLVTQLGKANFDLEFEKFGQAAQPFYFIVGYNEVESTQDSIKLNVLTHVSGYNDNVQNFIDTLDVGVELYNERMK